MLKFPQPHVAQTAMMSSPIGQPCGAAAQENNVSGLVCPSYRTPLCWLLQHALSNLSNSANLGSQPHLLKASLVISGAILLQPEWHAEPATVQSKLLPSHTVRLQHSLRIEIGRVCAASKITLRQKFSFLREIDRTTFT